MIVLLDSGPLGRLTSPHATPINQDCKQWLAHLAGAGVRVLVPEIADYEIRRDLLRIGSTRGIAALNRIGLTAGYLPITTVVMRQAAEFWARARQQGRPTAANAALDGDVILAAQASILATESGDQVIVATENPGHMARYVTAPHWRQIQPPSP